MTVCCVRVKLGQLLFLICEKYCSKFQFRATAMIAILSHPVIPKHNQRSPVIHQRYDFSYQLLGVLKLSLNALMLRAIGVPC